MRKVILSLALIFSMFFIVGCTKSSEKAEKSNTAPQQETQIKPYGTSVKVKGKNMNTYTIGNGDKNIVWIPGYGEFSPVLSYTKMLEELSPNYTVTVIEPFGYGLSDIIGEPRNINTIVEEIHEAVKQILGDKKYFLMGHSISGLYGMKYVNDYRDEVLGFIGIDSTTPDAFNGSHVVPYDSTNKDLSTIHEIPDVSDEINEQFKLIAKKVNLNKDVLNEGDALNETLKEAGKYSFPKDLPVLFLLAKESAENEDTLIDWVKVHTDLTQGLDYTETTVVEGDHLLFLTAYKELTRLINNFIENIPK